MYRVTNTDAQNTGRLFEQHEGTDIDPAAEVAVASLRQAVAMGRIGRRDTVALNITGGGQRRLHLERRPEALRPDATLTMEDLHRHGSARGVETLLEALG